MNVFEAIGMLWVIFTSALATCAIGYLALVGLRTIVNVDISWLKKIEAPAEEASDTSRASHASHVEHVEVKEAFKVAH